jgi:type II secretory pathway component PulM
MANDGEVAMTPRQVSEAVRQFWQARQPRERGLLALAVSVLALSLLWSLVLQPAWRQWAQAPANRLLAEQQQTRMLALAAQANALRQQPRNDPAQSRAALTQSVKDLGGQLTTDGARPVVELPRVPVAALANWLQVLGPQMGARITQASMQEVEPGHWSARITLELP